MNDDLTTDHEEACIRFIDWMVERVSDQGTGHSRTTLEERPDGVFWLGRLASEESVQQSRFGERGERLDPCATGLVLRLRESPPWTAIVTVRFKVWDRNDAKSSWHKIEVEPVKTATSFGRGSESHHPEELSTSLERAGIRTSHAARLDTDCRLLPDGTYECAITLVNSTRVGEAEDPNLYEAELEVRHLATIPFELDALPDSFRYDRQIPAYGINGGVAATDDGFRTSDMSVTSVGRPSYWNSTAPQPDLRFASLAVDALPACEQLYEAYEQWRNEHWSSSSLDDRARAERWTPEMRREADEATEGLAEESARIRRGLSLLQVDTTVRTAFALMNEAMVLATAGRGFAAWRPFQIGFLLANLDSVADPSAGADTADIVWFATGGGKTETYLGLLISAAFHDRLTGKPSGVTAWSRFPLRMLSLQQTQRFADAMAAAELVRQRHLIEGDPFSVGFYVGGTATPNRIPLEPARDDDPNVEDPHMPERYRVLSRCPFCRSDLAMSFDRVRWVLEHVCRNDECPWNGHGLPFYIVDDEIYRFLPTVVVGTVDKVANVAMQASMRGLVAAPAGQCDRPGHGFTYARRGSRKNGCLVPGCPGTARSLDPDTRSRIGPTFRLQDELHLMRDSLGAVDAHYEGLLDHLMTTVAGRRAKILASSATLAGFRRQVDVLYQRSARVFPQPPPSPGGGFWTRETESLARRFVALAPRGVTLEYAIDRLLTELQLQVRRLEENPELTQQFDVDPALAPLLVDLYGVDVVYGNTLRDLDAVVRSAETQIRVDGPVNTATLTGSTDFESVRSVLDRLDQPEPDFADRVHLVAASSMMSHGVDIDRLNVMAVYGLPLTTAEFIQATARAGRRHPALVFVLHKIARERDASIFRNFEPFVRHGDRFVDPVPVTRHSRRVLDRTLPGLVLARLLQVVEPRTGSPLTTVKALRDLVDSSGYDLDEELQSVIEALGFDGALDQGLRDNIRQWVEAYRYNLAHPPPGARWPNELCPGNGRPMLSLRDVEEQVPVIGLVQS